MKIVNHFGLRVDTEQERREFEQVGLSLPGGVEIPGGGVITSFDIEEDDPRWEKVVALATRFSATHTVRTDFSDPELDASVFLGLLACSNRGYPEPHEKMGYLAATFDLTEFCRNCGVGKKQIAPFQMRKDPGLKSTSMMQLNWVFDEFFTSPEAWAAVFKPEGIKARPVVLEKTGAEIPTVVQLDIQDAVDLDVKDAPFEDCGACGRRKHRYVLRGPYPKPIDAGEKAIFKSKEHFGQDRGAFKLPFISNAVHRRIREAGLRGVQFYPC